MINNQGYYFFCNKYQVAIYDICICNRLLLNILQVISQKYGLNL